MEGPGLKLRLWDSLCCILSTPLVSVFLPVASVMLSDFHSGLEMFLRENWPHFSGLLGWEQGRARGKVRTCTVAPASFPFCGGGGQAAGLAEHWADRKLFNPGPACPSLSLVGWL